MSEPIDAPHESPIQLVKWGGSLLTDKTRPETLRTDLSHVTYLYSGYDGAIILEGSRQLPWHLLPIKASAFEPLPKFLRKYPGDYNRFELRAYRMLQKFDRLKTRLRRLWGRGRG